VLFSHNLFDSHCHFDFTDFDQDRDRVWSDAKAEGIQQLLIPTVSPANWEKAQLIANKYRGIYWAAGLHPWWVENYLKNNSLDSLQASLVSAAKESTCIAIGETGLDAQIEFDINRQIEVFACHLQIAQEHSKPLVMHSRKTHVQLLSILKKNQFACGGVVHAFSGSYEQAKTFVDAGFYLGVGGVISYERANKTREAIKKIPLDYLVLETDAPDMPLQGEQGIRNTPVNLLRVAKHLANLKDLAIEQIADVTRRNTETLFGLPHAVR